MTKEKLKLRMLLFRNK